MAAVTVEDIRSTMRRAADILSENQQRLTDLDQEIGDGDMGITTSKIAGVFHSAEVQEGNAGDIGVFMMDTGKAVNRAASSTMGTLVATALMRAGKEVRGLESLTNSQIAEMFSTAVQAIQHRGKAQLGEKTIVDALHPAAETFRQAIEVDESLASALAKAADDAEAGRDKVTPLRSKIGRAAWVGERTEGKVDAGCEMAALVLRGLSQGVS